MPSDVCGECGRPLPHAHRPRERPDRGELPIVDLDGNLMFDPAAHQPPPAADRSRLVAGIVIIAVLVFGAWAFAYYGSGARDSEAEPAGRPTADEAAATPEPEPPPTTAADPAGEGIIGGVGEGEGVIASSLLAALDTSARISFLSDVGVTTIDLDSGVVTAAELGTDQLYDLDGLIVLSDGARSVALDPTDPTFAVLLSAGEVVTTADPDTYTVISVDGSIVDLYIGRVFEGFTRVLRPPVGSDRLSVPGLGVLITPPTGGTYVLTVTGFEQVTTARVVAANSDSWLEQRCDGVLECTAAFVDRGSGEETVVDPDLVEAGGSLLISPDSRWIVLSRSDDTWLYAIASGQAVRLPVSAPGPPHWAPDSSFVVWIDGATDEPALEFALMEAEEGGTFRVGLSALGDQLLPSGDGSFVVHAASG